MKKKIAIMLTTIFLLGCLGCSAYADDESWKENKINVNLFEATDKYEITKGGVYTLSGDYKGMIYVNTGDKVKIVLNGAAITSSMGPAIFVDNAEKIIIETVKDTVNILTDSEQYSVDAKACVFSNDDIDLQGEGTLVVNGRFKHGIASDDDIDVEGGIITINSAADGIHGNNDITFENGTINITSKEDAVQAEKNVIVNGGTFNIEATGEIEESKNEFEGFGRHGEGQIMENGQQPPEIHGEQKQPRSNNGQQPPEIPEGQQPAMQRGERQQGDFKRQRGAMDNGERPTFEGISEITTAPEQKTTAEGSTETTTEGISSKGLKADENIVINNGTLTVKSNDHCIKADGEVTVENGTINLNSNVGKGIKAVGNININGGSINIISKDESIETKAIMTINSGDINVSSEDDGINAGGGSGQMMTRGTEESEEHQIIFNGGNIHITAKGDGADSNGNIVFNGGNVDIDGPTSGGDSSIDFGGEAIVNGGTIFAVSSAGMVECPEGTDKQKVLNITLDEVQKEGSVIQIKDNSGNIVAEKTSAKDFQNIIYSSENIKSGETYLVYVNNEPAASIQVDSNTAVYGNGGRGMGRGMDMDRENKGEFNAAGIS